MNMGERRQKIHMLTLAIEKQLDVKEINLMAVGGKAVEIAEFCRNEINSVEERAKEAFLSKKSVPTFG